MIKLIRDILFWHKLGLKWRTAYVAARYGFMNAVIECEYREANEEQANSRMERS